MKRTLGLSPTRLVTVVRVLYQLYFDPIESTGHPTSPSPLTVKGSLLRWGQVAGELSATKITRWVGGWRGGGVGAWWSPGQIAGGPVWTFKKAGPIAPPPSSSSSSPPLLLSPSPPPAVEVFELKSRILAERATVINGRRSARRRRKKGKVSQRH